MLEAPNPAQPAVEFLGSRRKLIRMMMASTGECCPEVGGVAGGIRWRIGREAKELRPCGAPLGTGCALREDCVDDFFERLPSDNCDRARTNSDHRVVALVQGASEFNQG